MPKVLSSVLLFFLLLFYGINRLDSQSINYRIFDTESGLPSSEIYAVHQAKSGLLWFSSDRGVFTYNGYAFRTYTTNDGLGNNTSFGIFERDDASLWFVGYDGSLTRYFKGTFQVHKPITEFINKTYKNDWINTVFFDGDIIYFSMSKNKCLHAYNEKTGALTRLTQFEDKPRGTVIPLANSLFYVNYRCSYLSRSNPVYEAFTKLVKLNESEYVFTRYNWVYKINKTGTTFHVTDSIYFVSEMQSKNLLVRDSMNGDFFVANQKGVFLCNFNHPGKIKRQILSDINSHSILRDREGNFWVPTFNVGIVFIPSIEIKTFRNTVIGTEKITSVAHFNGTLVAGSASGTITFLREDGQFQAVNNANSRFPIEQLYLLNNETLLADRPLKLIQGVWTYQNTSRYKMNRMCELDKDRVLFTQHTIGVYGRGVYQFIHEPYLYKQIKSICYAQEKVWIGTISYLLSARLQGDTLVEFENHGTRHPLLAQRVNDIKKFRSGMLLAIFGKGLVYYDGQNVIHIQHPQLSEKVLINRLLVANNKQVILLTNNGLIKITFKNQAIFSIANIEYFDINDGLSSNFVNDACLDEGMLWIATNKGVDAVAMSDFRVKETTPPPINIIGLKTHDTSFLFQPVVHLNYDQNSFIIEYEGISLRKSNISSFYKYALFKKGEDTAWNYTNERFIQLTNLAPGEYVFIVTARNKNSTWAALKTMQIHIAPHFTQTWWFRSLLILLGLLLIYAVVRLRINSINKQNEQQKKVTQLATKAQETELMALRNQMNPHFIFNSLNSIQRYIISNHFVDANIYITKFSRLMRTSLSMSKLEYIDLTKEIEFVSTYMDLEKMRFENLFSYQINIEKGIDIDSTYIPTLLIQPLLENAIKHGFKNMVDGGLITIDIKRYDRQHLDIEVTDNGKGIDKLEEVLSEKKNETSFGLGIVMQRIRLLKETTNDDELTFKLFNIEQGVKAKLIIPFE